MLGTWLGARPPDLNDLLADETAERRLQGPDRALVLSELRRIRKSGGQARRHRQAIFTGIATSLVLVLCVYFTFASLISTIELADGLDPWTTRLAFAILQLSSYLLTDLAVIALLGWIRHARRPSAWSQVAVCGGVLVVGGLEALSALNLVLIVTDTTEAEARCATGIDLVWTIYAASQRCYGFGGSSSEDGWLLAASLRIVVILVVGLLWLWTLRRYVAVLAVSTIIDPRKAASSELQAILDRGGVYLADASWSEKAESQLPAMPERKRHANESKGWISSLFGWLFGRSKGTDDEEEIAYPARPSTPPPRRNLPVYTELYDTPTRNEKRAQAQAQEAEEEAPPQTWGEWAASFWR